MSLCRVLSCVVGGGCFLWAVLSLGKTLLDFDLLVLYSKAKFGCYSRYHLTSYFCIPVPCNQKETSGFVKLNGSMKTCKNLELTSKKDVLFITGDWNAKAGSQETPGVTGKIGLGRQNEAGQRLIEFCQENALVIPNTLFVQHKKRLYTWISPDGQHQNQIDHILCSQRWRSSIQSKKTKTRSWLWLRSWTPYYQIQTQIEESRENR